MTALFSAGTTVIDVSVDADGNPQDAARIERNLRDFISEQINARMEQLQHTTSAGERRGSQHFTDELCRDGRQFIGLPREGLQFWATCPSQDSWLDLQQDCTSDSLVDAFKKEFLTKFLKKFNVRRGDITLSIELRQSNEEEMKEALGKNSGDRASGQCSTFAYRGRRLLAHPYSKLVALFCACYHYKATCCF